MSAWWVCSICGAETLCAHREPDLVTWMVAGERHRQIEAMDPPPPRPKPPARENAGSMRGYGKFVITRRAER